MKIKSVTAIQIDLKLKEPFSIANETVEIGENVFLKIVTDEDIIGWGCTTPDSVTSETKETVADCFNNVIKDILIGKDPLRINFINDVIEEKVKGNPSLKAGVNMALYDILGKKISCLVQRELKRGSYEVNWYIGEQPSGIYFYKIEVGKYTDIKKMIILK